jgi:hypothetical protein
MGEVRYPGIDGFLGTRATFTLDLLVVAMFSVVLVLGWSVYQVKFRRRYQLHKWTQLTLAAVLCAIGSDSFSASVTSRRGPTEPPKCLHDE